MTDRVDMTTQRVLYRVPGEERVTVRNDIPFHADAEGALTLDAYLPPTQSAEGLRGAVVFVSGYPDPGMERMLGRKLKDMAAYVSWSRIVAASGLVAITYSNREPVGDAVRLLRFLRDNAAQFSIDSDRIALWACSGNVPNALALLMKENRFPIAAAVLAYGYMMDDESSSSVTEAAAQFHFANPNSGRHIDDLASDTPLCLVRAGADAMPGLNASIDRFTQAAVALDLPVTLINVPRAAHAFDIAQDVAATRAAVAAMLEFLCAHLAEKP